MKRAIALIGILALAMASLQANHGGARNFAQLIIESGHQPIIAELDGREINRRPEQTIRVDKVAPGKRRITLISPGGFFSGPHVVAERVIHVRPHAKLIASFNRWGHFKITQQRRHFCDRCENHYYGQHSCGPGHGQGYGQGHGPGYGPSSHGPQSGYEYGHGGGHYQQMGMQRVHFNQLKQSIRRASFESTKKSIMRQGLRGRQITSQQLGELLSLMSFENSKLTMARWAYDKVVDPENIYVIYQEFSFESSVRRLEKDFGGNW